ncbi:hypothetical protein [Actinomadura litoris]|uniref:hypothetical protein n=1 Tax=Actinomadura litoris TaxID=2678616 RepID=UPI0035590DC9
MSVSPSYDQAIGTWCREDKYVVFRAEADTDILTFEATPQNSNIELSYLDRD